MDIYRPRRLADLFGQSAAVNVLSKFVANPHPKAFLFEGETGTGKTSAALALAAELGCDVAQQEFGGVNVISSGEQTADTVRQMYNRLFLTPMLGSGWKVLIVNEADRMGGPAETIWLDRLEQIPGRSVVIFTTNYSEKMAARLKDRCTRIKFQSDEKTVKSVASELLAKVWREQTGTNLAMAVRNRIIAEATDDGHISFRRLLQTSEKAMDHA